MPDAPDAPENVFAYARPTLVVGEATTEDAQDNNALVEHAVANVNSMNVEMSSVFEKQFNARYMPRVFQSALNYDCGGADYGDLFSRPGQDDADVGRTQRSRRDKEALVPPGVYKQMMATRAESQLAKDWLSVPAAQNLHWRWQVLQSLFLTCKQKVKPGDTLDQNLVALVEAARTLMTRIQRGSITISGKLRPMKGEVAMLFRDETLNSSERTLLTSYLKTASIHPRGLAGFRVGHLVGRVLGGMVWGCLICLTILDENH